MYVCMYVCALLQNVTQSLCSERKTVPHAPRTDAHMHTDHVFEQVTYINSDLLQSEIAQVQVLEILKEVQQFC